MNTVLHIYPAKQPHDDIIIVGDIWGMRQLRKACDDAIFQYDYGKKPILPVGVFHTDGEGYLIQVKVVAEKQMDDLPIPYSDPSYNAGNTKAEEDALNKLIYGG